MSNKKVQELINTYKQRKYQKRFSSIGDFKEYIDSEWLDASTRDYRITYAFPATLDMGAILEEIKKFYIYSLDILRSRTDLILNSCNNEDPLDDILLNELLAIEEAVLYLNDTKGLLFKSTQYHEANTSPLRLLERSYKYQKDDHDFFRKINK